MNTNHSSSAGRGQWSRPANLFSEYQHLDRSVTIARINWPEGSHVVPHKHERDQLLYAQRGIMRAATEHGIWFIPPMRALWIPAGIVHDQIMLSAVEMRSVFVDTSTDINLGNKCRVIEVHPLLRELIIALADQSLEYELDDRNKHIVGLMLSEIARSRTVPLVLPWPKDKRIVPICETVLKSPGEAPLMSHWAQVAGASLRTLIRLFQKETGLSYRQWVQHARLAEALTRLENGNSVADVANGLGYSNPSAFTVMFRRILGETPSDYLARRQH